MPSTYIGAPSRSEVTVRGCGGVAQKCFQVNFSNICVISILLSVRMAEFLDDDDLLAIYVIFSEHAANKIRKKRSLDKRLTPETRSAGSCGYFTGITAIILAGTRPLTRLHTVFKFQISSTLFRKSCASCFSFFEIVSLSASESNAFTKSTRLRYAVSCWVFFYLNTHVTGKFR